MDISYPTTAKLAISLGSALKQTFDELQDLQAKTRAAHHELLILNMLNQTLKDENLVLRERQVGLEETLAAIEAKSSATIVEHKESYKQENVKIARVLRRTLQALKRSKIALDRLQEEVDRLYIRIDSFDEVIYCCFEEIGSLHQDRLEILELALAPKNQGLEQKLKLLEEAYQTLKEKAKSAILAKEEEVKKLKTAFQELLSKTKEEDQLKQRMFQLSTQNGKLQAEVETLKRSLLSKEEEVREWQEKHYTTQIRLNQTENELSNLGKMKSEYERMHLLFSNIKAYMGPEIPNAPEPSADLFTIQKPKSLPIQEELF